MVGARRPRPDAGRAGDAVRARHVQGRAVHGGRHHRPRHRHPRHPQAGLARRAAAGRCSSSRSAATASMAALPPFLGFVAKEADFETVAHSDVAGRRAAPLVLAGVVFGSVFTTIYSLRFLWGAFARKGRLASRASRGGQPAPAARGVPGRPGDPGRGRAGVRSVAAAGSTTSSTTTPTPCPRGRRRDYHLALWHGFEPAAAAVDPGAGGGHGGVLRPRPAAPAPGSRYLPLGNADRIYDAVMRGADVLVGAADRASPSAARSRRRSRSSCRRWCCCRSRCWSLGARNRPGLRGCGTRRCRWWSA